MVSPKENVIIIRLTGGLGNQMFQYAVGRTTSLKARTSLKLDISSYANDKFGRHYSLDIFNIKATLATPQEIEKLRPVENFFTRKSPRLFRLLSFLSKTYINEDLNGGVIPQNMSQLYLDGYWQNEKYFVDYGDQIRQDFQLKPRPDKQVANYLKKIKSTNSVAIHIRRGDYVSNTRIARSVGICGIRYYQRAMKFVTKHVNNPVFFIFSEKENFAWIKAKLIIEPPFLFVNNDDFEDLRLISSCKHNIVANSSFSWWGAWLNNNPKKIVVAPDPWLAKESKSSVIIVPHQWVKLPKA